MKYGEQFEANSVPEWSLYNIDYNSLKHHIKAHTKKDQAAAIAIPGHQDTALCKFEDGLYTELCRQHDRVDLFVSSKADEISRRLQYLSTQIHRLMIRCASSRAERQSLKRQRRSVKYEQDLQQCNDDIRCLQRFVGAQIVAFRKILKKYRKWTGSSTLGARFRENVLSDPKSFTRRGFSNLQALHDDLRETLRAALPSAAATFSCDSGSGTVSPTTEANSPPPPPSQPLIDQASPTDTIEPPARHMTGGYWNEYDDGSEAGDAHAEDDYAIYVNPNEDLNFPGVTALMSIFAMPIRKMRSWASGGTTLPQAPHDTDGDDNGNGERGPLLPRHHDNTNNSRPYGTITSTTTAASSTTITDHQSASYFASTPGGWTDTDVDDSGSDRRQDNNNNNNNSNDNTLRRGSYPGGGYASSTETTDYFPAGYKAHYAATTSPHSITLPSIEQQRMAAYREHMLFWATWACFAVSFVLMGIATILIMTGRHKLRLEVDAGMLLGIVASLGCACAGLGMSLARQDHTQLHHHAHGQQQQQPQHTAGGRGGGWANQLAVWITFATACVLNGMLLVLMVGNAPMPVKILMGLA
ncbi:SPX domain-containing protein [Bombardia bombarda]|uniref:SPX domain-containing protein n=1 Tax=Bombardia bombarda TaxID=252184 RepID=A0AA39WGM3_9PEZI|nr:SPX domain-containing protein [Bombardia bombarda]